MGATFPLKIMTPDGVAYDGLVTSVSCRTINGQVQLLAKSISTSARHWAWARLISLEDGTTRRAACMGGMLSMMRGECHLLATPLNGPMLLMPSARAQQSACRGDAGPEKNLDKRDMELAEARLGRALVRSSVAARKDI